MTWRRWLGLVLAVGAAALLLAQLPERGERDKYRTLDPQVYHPTFFADYQSARARKDPWVRSAPAIGLEYIGQTRVCPVQRVVGAARLASTMTLVVERVCPYSNLATLQQFRIELVEEDGVWQMVWAGVRYKCATNRSAMAVMLMRYSPVWTSPAHWAAPLNSATKFIADGLNPWLWNCA